MSFTKDKLKKMAASSNSKGFSYEEQDNEEFTVGQLKSTARNLNNGGSFNYESNQVGRPYKPNGGSVNSNSAYLRAIEIAQGKTPKQKAVDIKMRTMDDVAAGNNRITATTNKMEAPELVRNTLGLFDKVTGKEGTADNLTLKGKRIRNGETKEGQMTAAETDAFVNDFADKLDPEAKDLLVEYNNLYKSGMTNPVDMLRTKGRREEIINTLRDEYGIEDIGKANDYIDRINNKEATEAVKPMVDKVAESGNLGRQALTVAEASTKLIGDVMSTGELAKKALGLYVDDNLAIDTNSSAMMLSNVNDYIGEKVGSEYKEDGKQWAYDTATKLGFSEDTAATASDVISSVYGFTYDAERVILENIIPASVAVNYFKGAGLADKAAREATSKLITDAFFISGMNSGVKEAQARNLTNEQSMALGAAYGFFEWATERMGLDKALGFLMGDITENAFRTGVVNFFEEAFGELAADMGDDLADYLITGDKSKDMQEIYYYMSDQYTADTGDTPMTQEQATQKMLEGKLKSYFYTFALGGFTSAAQNVGVSGAYRFADTLSGRRFTSNAAAMDEQMKSLAAIDRESMSSDEAYNKKVQLESDLLHAYNDNKGNKKTSFKEGRNLVRNIREVNSDVAETRVINDIQNAKTATELETVRETSGTNEKIDAVYNTKKAQMLASGLKESDFTEAKTPKNVVKMAEEGKTFTTEEFKELPQATREAYTQARFEYIANHSDNLSEVDINQVRANGKTQSIKDVVKEGDSLYFVLEDGTKEKASDVMFTDKGNILYNGSDEKGVEGILQYNDPELVKLAMDVMAKGNTNSLILNRALGTMYTLGKTGVSFESALEKYGYMADKFGAETLRQAYNLAKNEDEKVDKSKAEAFGKKNSGINYESKEAEQAYKDLSKASKKVLDLFSKKLGVQFSYFVEAENEKSEQLRGSYTPSKGIIRINLESGNIGNILEVALHEGIGEFLQAHNAKGYESIAMSILNYYASNNATQLAKDIRAYYKAYGEGYTENAYELVNDALSDILSTEAGINKMAKWLSQNESKSAAQKVLDVLSDYVATIKEMIAEMKQLGGLDFASRSGLEMSEEMADKLADEIFSAMDVALENRNIGKDNNENVQKSKYIKSIFTSNEAELIASQIFHRNNGDKTTTFATKDGKIGVRDNRSIYIVEEMDDDETELPFLPHRVYDFALSEKDTKETSILMRMVENYEKHFEVDRQSSRSLLSTCIAYQRPYLQQGDNVRVYNLSDGGRNARIQLGAKGKILSRDYSDTRVSYNGRTNFKQSEQYKDNSYQLIPRKSLKVDSQGKELTEDQATFFKNVDDLLRDENGAIKRYYHGTARMDRVGTVFRPDRATSGPMAYFTDDPQIAENYSKSKADTSMAYEDKYQDYYTQFTITKSDGREVPITKMFIPTSLEMKLKKNAPHVTLDEDGEEIIFDENVDYGVGNFKYALKDNHGNVMKALVDEWLSSGTLFGEEERFLEVLKLAGLEDEVTYHNPDYREEGVYEVYLNIQKAFDTSDISDEVLTALKERAESVEYDPMANAQADAWDKNGIEPTAWIKELEDDIANNTTYAWTRIPDFVTDTLKEFGYDGIVDKGGKYSSIGHQVVIPFSSNQVKNINNEHPTEDVDIRKSIKINSSLVTKINDESYKVDYENIPDVVWARVAKRLVGIGGEYKRYNTSELAKQLYTEELEKTNGIIDAKQVGIITEAIEQEKENLNEAYMTKDTNGKELSKNTIKYFKNETKELIDGGRLKVMYHGTPSSPFTAFDSSMSDDGISLFFTDDFDVATSYSGDDFEITSNSLPQSVRTLKQLVEYAGNEFTVEKANKGYNVGKVGQASVNFSTIEEAYGWMYWMKNDRNVNTYKGGVYPVYLKSTNPLVIDAKGKKWNDIESDIEELNGATTRDYSRYAKEHGYDALIINNLVDIGTYGSMKRESQVVVVFDSNQVKSVDNENPTSDSDIRKSIKVLGETSPYYDTIMEADTISGVLSTINNKLKGLKFNEKSLIKTYEKIFDKYKLDAALQEEVAYDVYRVFDYMQKNQNVNYTDMMDYLMQIGNEVISNSKMVNPEQQRVYDEMKQTLKGYSIKLTEAEKKELANRYGGKLINALGQMKKYGINISSEGSQLDGSTFEEIANDFLQIAGVSLDTSMAAQDQIISIIDTMQALTPSAMEFDGATDQDLALMVASDIIEGIYTQAANEIKEEASQQIQAEIKAGIKAETDKIRQEVNAYKKAKETAYMDQVEKLKAELTEKNAEISGWGNKYELDTKQIEQTAKINAKKQLQSYKAAEERAKQIDNIKKTGNRLVKWLNNPSDKQHVPTFLQRPLISFLSGIDFLPASAKLDSKSTQNWLVKMQGLRDILKKLENMEEAESDSLTSYEMSTFSQVIVAKELVAKMDDFINSVSKMDEETGALIPTKTKVSSLDEVQLKELNELMSSISTAINNMNKTFANAAFKDAEELARTSVQEMSELRVRKNHSKLGNTALDFMSLDEAEPITFFEGLGDAAKSIFDELRAGFDRKISRVKQASEYMDAAKKNLGLSDKEISSWKKQTYTFKFAEGTVTASIPQIMALYETNKREQGKPHIKLGGIKIADVEVKEGKITKISHQSKATHITYAEFEEMISKLSDKQIALADAMQKFMATECASWGNTVAKKMYGYEKFLEPDYFPLVTDSYSRAVNAASDQNVSYYNIKNQGFTKAVKPSANNAVVINDIFDVFTNHVVGMADYEGYVMPIADAMRWFNYNEAYMNATEEGTRLDNFNNMQEAIDRVLGVGGGKYFRQFIKDINGDRAGKGGGVELVNTLMSNYKAQAVMANVRVIVQQPTAYIRALDVIEGKYLTEALGSIPKASKYAKKAQDNSIIAYWKAQGYYETMLGQSLKEIITGDNTLKDRINNVAGAAAGKADDLTWGLMYKAAELKVSETRPDLKYDSDEYVKEVVKVFEDVVDHTQVVDTIFHKSQIMRSQNTMAKTLTSFMAEPTKTVNMLYRRLREASYANSKAEAARIIGRVSTVFLTEQMLNAAVTAIIDAARDDDRDKWKDAYLEKLWANLMGNLNPLALIPIGKEFVSAFEGYDATRIEVEGIYTSVKTLTELGKVVTGDSKKTPYGVAQLVAQSISQIFGIPLYTAMREVKTFWNAVNDIWDGTDIYTTETQVNKAEKKKLSNSLDEAFEAKDLSKIKESTNEMYQRHYDNYIKDKSEEEAQKQALTQAKKDLTEKYKPIYIELAATDKQAATKLKKNLIYAYMSLGKSEKDATRDIDAWLK